MSDFSPTVSVVIATLNEEEGIGPTIDEMQRVLKNPYMVVVDGNSVDKTIEIAKKTNFLKLAHYHLTQFCTFLKNFPKIHQHSIFLLRLPK